MKAKIEKALQGGLPHSVLSLIRNRRSPVRAAAPAPGALRVASYNIHKCVGTDRRFDPARIQRVIAEIDPDILALQEADRRFGDRRGLLDLSLLAEQTGLVPVPVEGIGKAHGWHGNLLLVRRGLVERVEQIALPGFEPRGALVTDLDFGTGTPLRVIAAHFGLLRRCRTRQTRLLSGFMADEARPAVLMGDLNEWRVDRASSLAGVCPVPAAVPSFPSRFPVLPLDRIIASRADLLSPVCVHDSVLARVASDHLPITAVLTLDQRASSA